MADSDEENEGGRRDKFRRERSDYGDSKSRTKGEKRTWREETEVSRRRSYGSREDYYDEDRERRRFSPRRWSPPPPKRMRREGWSGYRDFPGMMGPYGMRPPWMHHPDMPPPHHQMGPGPGPLPGDPIGSAKGPMKQALLTFKQYLTQQDDSIDESDAIQKYSEYKSEFKRKQIAEFFDEHKEEDWLVSKYHPKPVKERKEAMAANLQARLRAFLFLLEGSYLDKAPISRDHSSNIIRTMDAAIIIMEGGVERDLLSLDTLQKDQEEGEEEKKEGEKEGEDKDKPSFMVIEPTEEQRQLAQQAMDYGKVMTSATPGGGGTEETLPQEDTEQLPKKSKKKRKKQQDAYTYKEGGESEGSSSESEQENEETAAEEPPPPGMESDPPPPGTEPLPPGMEEPTTGEVPPLDSGSALPETGQTEAVEPAGQAAASEKTNGVPIEGEEEEGLPAPRALHLTRSVYIRHIPPKISGDDIIEVCRTIPGYLRIAFADCTPEKGYERRGWVTYKDDTDIRDACARLTITKIKDCQLNCMVNRDLTRRTKYGVGVLWAKKVVHSDLHLILRVIQALDQKNELWEHSKVQPTTGESGEEIEKPPPNPVLSFPESLLTEDEEPLVASGGGEEEEGVISDPGTEIMSEEEERVKTLDRLIWYLRIVHSVDYYNTTVFPSEDCMPHRCGIITARAHKPTAVTQEEMSEHIESMETKIRPILETRKELSEDDMEKYGKKDPEAEVERFIDVNTQRLSENKYLCPLSGKKFKGPDFVLKHIFNKHMDKLEEARQEAEFFNNYLRDPDRPMPLEATVSSSIIQAATPTQTEDIGPGPSGSAGSWGQSAPMMMFGRGGYSPGMMGFSPGMMGRGQFRGPRGGRRGRGRRVVHYHDLDAPEEMY